MKRLLFTLVLVGHFAPAAGGEQRAFADGMKRPLGTRLVKVNVLGRSTLIQKVGEALEPGRVYLFESEKQRKGLLVVANQKGQLPRPLEALAPGSVLPAVAVGGESGKHYVLDQRGEWSAVDWPVSLNLWTVEKNAKFRISTYPVTPKPSPGVSRQPAQAPRSLFSKPKK